VEGVGGGGAWLKSLDATNQYLSLALFVCWFQFLSMKLASVNSQLDFNLDSIINKEVHSFTPFLF
jgi:hypothetical protein